MAPPYQARMELVTVYVLQSLVKPAALQLPKIAPTPQSGRL
jgi:hypothetical protein